MAKILIDSDDIVGLAKALHEALERKGYVNAVPPKAKRVVPRQSNHNSGMPTYGCGWPIC